MSADDLGFLDNLVTFMPSDVNNCVNDEPMRPEAPLMIMFLWLNFYSIVNYL